MWPKIENQLHQGDEIVAAADAWNQRQTGEAIKCHVLMRTSNGWTHPEKAFLSIQKAIDAGLKQKEITRQAQERYSDAGISAEAENTT